MNQKLLSLINEIVDADIDVTIQKSTIHGITFDLHLESKSGMHLYLVGDQLFVDMRYGETHPIDDMADLIRLAHHGMHGRDFVNTSWLALIKKAGLRDD